MTNIDSELNNRDITFPTKACIVKVMVFPVCMYRWELDHKEGWVLKNWCFWVVVLVKTLESPLDCKEIQPIHHKGNESWIVTGRTDAETEAPILWPPDTKSWLIGKDPDAEQDWRQEEKGKTEDEMAGWHHRLSAHQFWAIFGIWWRTGKPGVLQSMGSQSWTRLSDWTNQYKGKKDLLQRSTEQQIYHWQESILK